MMPTNSPCPSLEATVVCESRKRKADMPEDFLTQDLISRDEVEEIRLLPKFTTSLFQQRLVSFRPTKSQPSEPLPIVAIIPTDQEEDSDDVQQSAQKQFLDSKGKNDRSLSFSARQPDSFIRRVDEQFRSLHASMMRALELLASLTRTNTGLRQEQASLSNQNQQLLNENEKLKNELRVLKEQVLPRKVTQEL